MTKHPADVGLNRVMNALRYSLASYLQFARPWIGANARADVVDAIARVADHHRDNVMRLGELLIERHRHVELQSFPTAFTGLNDLSVEYLLPLVIENEKRIIRLVEATAGALEHDIEAHRVLAEFVDREKLHLQSLVERKRHRKEVAAEEYSSPRCGMLERPRGNGRRQIWALPEMRHALQQVRDVQSARKAPVSYGVGLPTDDRSRVG